MQVIRFRTQYFKSNIFAVVARRKPVAFPEKVGAAEEERPFF
jgi:hypothetical protein